MAATAVRRDLAAGGLLTAFGALTAWESSRYAFGTLGRMGPGYYPALLGGGMVVVGLLIVLNRGGAEAGLDEGPPPLDWRGAVRAGDEACARGVRLPVLTIRPAPST